MSEIVKTEAFVLKKINYSNSSKIVTIYTKEFGKLSAIVKGGRLKNSKVGITVDNLNLINVVLYKKEQREIQLISNADLISFYPKLKEDFEKLKYAYAVLELIDQLIVEKEPNQKIFNGIKRIFELLESSNELSIIIFCRFYLFFIQEIGYEIRLDKCSICNSEIKNKKELRFSFAKGIICPNCISENMITNSLFGELFEYLVCLKFNKKINECNLKIINKVVGFLENFLKFHIQEFKGLNSLKLN